MSNSTISFMLDGVELQAQAGETLLKAAQRHGVDIPHLCFSDGLRADGNCRACVVEVAGERTLAASCCRSVTPGLKVLTDSLRAKKSRQMVLELLLSDLPATAYRRGSELDLWAARLGVVAPRFPARAPIAGPTAMIAELPQMELPDATSASRSAAVSAKLVLSAMRSSTSMR